MLIQRFSRLSTLAAGAIALLSIAATVPAAIAAPLPEAGMTREKSNAVDILYPSFESLFAIELLEGLPPMAGVDLSADQASQIGALLDDARVQIQEIFTLDQQNLLVAELNRGEDLNRAMETIALSDTQESNLQFVVQYFGFQASSVLTPEQQQIISENLQASNR